MEGEKLILRDDVPIFVEDIKECLQKVYDQVRAVQSRNKFLEEEIKRVKAETYKDEELSKMKKEYEMMKAAYYRGFPISSKENKAIQDWIGKLTEGQDFRKVTGGPIGGRFHYEFIPTSVGTVGRVIDSITKEKFTFQEL